MNQPQPFFLFQGNSSEREMKSLQHWKLEPWICQDERFNLDLEERKEECCGQKKRKKKKTGLTKDECKE